MSTQEDELWTINWEPCPRTGSGCWPSSPTPTTWSTGRPVRVARWTKAGKWVGYVVVTNGEAGIDGLPPDEAGPIRMAEQEHSANIVGVDDVRFLGYPDGVVEPGRSLRRDVAREVRRSQPDVLLIAT